MRLHLATNLILALVIAAAAQAAPPIELELATERGLQITAPQQWLQLLASLGIEHVRIRTAGPGDQPQLANRGSDARPRYHVVGILSARDELHLPGGMFRATDRKKLQDYFARLAAEGSEGVTAPRGRFGLTDKQLIALHAELAQPLDPPTKGEQPAKILEQLQSKLNYSLSLDAAVEQALRAAEPFPDEVRGLTVGTGLAIVLRNYGLALRPEKPRGEPVVLRILPLDDNADAWPIGWDPERRVREVAPVLMESLNVEIANYTLRETLDAIQPRVKIPFFVDHLALAKNGIDLDKVPVRIPQTRTFYKRTLDVALAKARLAGNVRVDEAGKPFLWITR
jgi:hypothetical protein